MKKLLLMLLLGICVSAFGQGARFGDANPTQTTAVIPGTSGLLVKVIPGATINFCSWPANAVPCTNKATTYTDYTLQTACSTSIQVVLSGTTNCVGTADPNGNWGVWVAPGLYQYTFTYQGNNYGPFFAIPTGNGVSTLNCPNAANLQAGTGAVGVMTSVTGFNCDANFISDLHGNFSAQSGKFLGPVNGFFGVIGGASDPGTVAAYKLNANEVRALAPLSVSQAYYWRWPSAPCSVGQVWQATASTTDSNGDRIVTYGCVTPSNGGITYPAASNPATPVISQGGTPGAANYSYVVACTQDGLGTTSIYHSNATAAGTTATGNASLSSTNYNLITGYADTLYGYRGCNVWRTAGGATQGLIATNVGKAFRDTGLAGDGSSPPSTNTTILDPTGPARGANRCNSIFHSPEGVDAIPCTPNILDDEFAHTFGAPSDVNDGVWQWGNQASATASWTNGELQINPDTSNAVEYITAVTALPTAPYTFEIYVSVNAFGVANGNGNGCFIGLKESSTGKIAHVEIGYSQTANTVASVIGGVWIVRNESANAVGAPVIYQAFQMTSGYVKIQNNGSGNITYSFSNDGVNFVQATSQALTTPFTTAPNQLILGGLGVGGGTTRCTFDFLRRTQ